jgi:hypothetical protein
MVSTVLLLGTMPTLAERLAALEHQLAVVTSAHRGARRSAPRHSHRRGRRTAVIRSMVEDETGDESHRLFSIGTIEIVSSGSGPLRFQRASPVDRRHFHRAASVQSVQSVGLSRAIAAGYLSDEADFREIRNDQERSALIGDNLVGFRSHAASVPSIGGSSLQAALARVRGAEQALTVAREEACAAARRAAVSLSGLFSDTEYVPRNTADRWVSEARLDGANAVADAISRGMSLAEDPPSIWPSG